MADAAKLQAVGFPQTEGDVARTGARLVGELLLNAVPRAVGFAALGFLVALALLLVLRSKGAFRRTPVWWHRLSKVVYLWVPLVLMACGAALGLVSGAHALVDAKVKEFLTPFVRSELPGARDWVVSHVDWQPGREYSVDEATDKVVRALQGQTGEGLRARVVNAVVARFGRAVIDVALRLLLKQAVGRAGEALNLDDDTVRFTVGVLAEMDPSRLDENFVRVFEDALLRQLAKVFHALELKVALLTLAALALPAVDAGVYFLWFLKRARPAPGGAA